MTTERSASEKSSDADELGFKDEHELTALYRTLLDCWNRRNAAEFAALFAPDGSLVGFDGSQINGRTAIVSHLSETFAHHRTPSFVGILREVRILAPEVALLRAVAGMASPGQSELNPALNAVQSLVAAQHAGLWRIDLFQNTPAAFHGRPEACERLSDELRRALPKQGL